jgi:hypothetical protein
MPYTRLSYNLKTNSPGIAVKSVALPRSLAALTRETGWSLTEVNQEVTAMKE